MRKRLQFKRRSWDYPHASPVLSLIADVDAPLTAVVGRDAVAGAPCDATQGERHAQGDLTDMLLLERPPPDAVCVTPSRNPRVRRSRSCVVWLH